jgi:hypothetical protein
VSDLRTAAPSQVTAVTVGETCFVDIAGGG